MLWEGGRARVIGGGYGLRGIVPERVKRMGVRC